MPFVTFVANPDSATYVRTRVCVICVNDHVRFAVRFDSVRVFECARARGFARVYRHILVLACREGTSGFEHSRRGIAQRRISLHRPHTDLPKCPA